MPDFLGAPRNFGELPGAPGVCRVRLLEARKVPRRARRDQGGREDGPRVRRIASRSPPDPQ
eukprot:2900728-Pyramimonas_sp.AAC.1